MPGLGQFKKKGGKEGILRYTYVARLVRLSLRLLSLACELFSRGFLIKFPGYLHLVCAHARPLQKVTFHPRTGQEGQEGK